MIKIKFKKAFLFSSFLGLTVVVSTIAAACATAPSAQDLSQKKVNVISKDTPYEKIHNLEFSFQFNNTGGFSMSDDRQSQPYSVFGTGWLFDWKLNSEKPDSDGNISWTGYFGTNLHVADALLNSSDNEPYTPSWLLPNSILRGDHTRIFRLGKYDNSNGPLSSINRNTNLTYITLSTLPTTQFAAINFVSPEFTLPGIVGNNSQIKEPTGNYPPYIDFAVLAIKINYVKNPFTANQIAENNVWIQWIQPAMQTLQSLYPKNETDPNLTYQKIFSATDLTKSMENWGNIYIAGYPYYNSASGPYMAGQNNFNGVTGSPVWTINIDKNSNLYTGQPIDIKNTFGSSGPDTPNGVYNSNAHLNFMLNYHGQDYKQYGVGYIITDSNLAGGSSGSMALDNNNKLLGIYYGTLSSDTNENDELSIGLLETLILSNANYPTALAPNLTTDYQIFPYDLIGWSPLNSKITHQDNSYFNSLTSSTYLFPNIIQN